MVSYLNSQTVSGQASHGWLPVTSKINSSEDTYNILTNDENKIFPAI